MTSNGSPSVPHSLADERRSVVLDAFAMMALLEDEPGASLVQEVLQSAVQGKFSVFISMVNLGEVLYATERRSGVQGSHRALAFIDQAPIQPLEVDRPTAIAAARIKASTGLGYADCFAVSCAQIVGASVLTGDPGFKRVEHIVPVDWLPQRAR